MCNLSCVSLADMRRLITASGQREARNWLVAHLKQVLRRLILLGCGTPCGVRSLLEFSLGFGRGKVGGGSGLIYLLTIPLIIKSRLDLGALIIVFVLFALLMDLHFWGRLSKHLWAMMLVFERNLIGIIVNKVLGHSPALNLGPVEITRGFVHVHLLKRWVVLRLSFVV